MYCFCVQIFNVIFITRRSEYDDNDNVNNSCQVIWGLCFAQKKRKGERTAAEKDCKCEDDITSVMVRFSYGATVTVSSSLNKVMFIGQIATRAKTLTRRKTNQNYSHSRKTTTLIQNRILNGTGDHTVSVGMLGRLHPEQVLK